MNLGLPTFDLSIDMISPTSWRSFCLTVSFFGPFLKEYRLGDTLEEATGLNFCDTSYELAPDADAMLGRNVDKERFDFEFNYL